jgi:hypothetical protein
MLGTDGFGDSFIGPAGEVSTIRRIVLARKVCQIGIFAMTALIFRELVIVGVATIVSFTPCAAQDSRSPDSRSPDSRSPDSRSPGRFDPGRERVDVAEIAAQRVVWPSPVRHRQADAIRQVDFFGDSRSVIDSHDHNSYEQDDAMAYGLPPAFAAPTVPPHQLLVAPNQLRRSDRGSFESGIGSNVPGRAPRPPAQPLHPNYRLHHQVQAPPAVIPNATRRETWKTPYSYGHFGASHTRSWNRHNAYRDNVTEWRLK